jgi:DNA (cytosine-5)-methyltransferase 1
MPLVFATDCTGIDAPLHCVKSIMKKDYAEVRYLFASEINPKLRSVLQTVTPHPEIIFDNIRDRLRNEEYGCVDLYIAGFPCQSFSTLGKREGLLSDQGSIFWDILDFLQKAQPKIFVLENVSKLLTHRKGQTFQTIMNQLNALSFYHVEYKILSPLDIGFPQSRSRMFIVGTHMTKLASLAVWPELDRLDVSLQSLLLTREEAYALQPSSCRPLCATARRNITALDESTDMDQDMIVDLSPSLRFALKPRVGRCPCLKRYNQMFYITTQKRYITYRECLRLQGFDDSIFQNVVYKAKRGELSHADVHAYAGNSMCIPLLRTILAPLLKLLLCNDI